VILGIATSHNATAALVDLDGRVVGAASAERFTREKFDVGFPSGPVEYVTTLAPPGEIKYIAVGENLLAGPFHNSPRTLMNIAERTTFLRNPFNMAMNYARSYLGLRIGAKFSLLRRLTELLGEYGVSGEIRFVEHHVSHAASACFTGEVEDGLIVSIDGQGDQKSALVVLADGNRLERVQSVSRYDSPGNVYAFITTILGFKQNRHEGKITGLAGYGDPAKTRDGLAHLLALVPEGEHLTFSSPHQRTADGLHVPVLPRLVLEYVKWLLRGDSIAEYVYALYDVYSYRIRDRLLPGLTASREDIAAGVQWLLEDRVTRFVQHYLRRHGKRELALAGGVFANVKLNQRLFNLPEVDRIFIHPGMGDEGLALGAAYQVLAEVNPGFKRQPLRDVYLGPAYSEAEVARALVGAGVKYRRVEDETALAEEAAARIAAGQVLGLFRGRMEYGPRALGARSVLADPRRREMHDTLNRKLRRSEFMPFAPVIPSERAYELLDGKVKGSEHAAEFMTLTYAVHPAWRARIPAVVHVDGTARPQLLRREVNPFYYAILAAFERRTGVPVLINTSFNLHEEPIVCSPQDALRAFAQGGVDAMVMERYVVER
jgi:carbamoyltransferase